MNILEYALEEKYSGEGYSVICGTDEAGRGPLAGPVFAAAVILPRGLLIEGLNDSKKISEKKRELLFNIIRSEAVSYGIASASVEEIDEFNILNAAQIAMRRAVSLLNPTPDLVLVDGKVSQQAFFTDKEAIEFIISRSHPVINGEGWNYQGIDKDLKVTKYQITDVMIGY